MRRDLLVVPLALLALLAGCVASGPVPARVSTLSEDGISELEVQALAMQMADDYNAALGETTYLVLRREDLDPTARWLALSFLRNGMGATLDIAAGPNPDVSLLDLLVIGSLQTWAFEAHWIPAGISAEGRAAAVTRLQAAESAMWESARRVLSSEQESTLRELIAQWIEEHPDRTVVSFVRFDDFTEERELSTAVARGTASGLLRDVGEATAAVQDARLFGERALWFASRYPYILGQQAELTAYRIADQPEAAAARETLASARRLADALAQRLERFDADEQMLFDRLGAERAAAIDQLRDSLGEITSTAMKDLGERIEHAREAAVDHFFRRFATEREVLVELLDSTHLELDTTLGEAREAALASAEAGRALTATAEAADRLVGRFDRDRSDGREPLSLADLRVTAVEANAAAAQLNVLLDRLDAMADSEGFALGLAAARETSSDLADALFLRGAVLIVLLIAGLALVRRVVQR